MSEQKVICCPRCGTPRTNNGVFCGECGYQLIDGKAHMRAHDTRRTAPRDNVYAKKKVTGYSTYWQTEGRERKIVTGIMYFLMVCLALGVLLCFMGNFILGLALAAFTFVGFIVTAVISSLRPSNREQIKQNGVYYGGKVSYKRNPVTGELEDNSDVKITSASDKNDD